MIVPSIKSKIYTFVKAAYAARGYYSTRLFGRRMRLDPARMEFWRATRRGFWEPETIALLTRVLRPHDVYLDAGAWIGPTVLCAAPRCTTVYCIEPDRYAYESLLMNIRLNGLNNVVPFHLALSDRDGMARMASTGTLGDTMTSLLARQEGKQVLTVPCLSWSSFLDCFHPEVITVMKIDIEGAEFMLLPAMREYLSRNKPVLYLSTHAPFFRMDERRKKLQTLADILSLYDGCLTSDMKHASPDALFSEDVMDGYPALLFYDTATRPDLP